MPRFHVSKSGAAAPCNAVKTACPLGGEVPHAEFPTQLEAQFWAEKKLEEEYGGSFSPKSFTEPAPQRAEFTDSTSADEIREGVRSGGGFRWVTAKQKEALLENKHTPSDVLDCLAIEDDEEFLRLYNHPNYVPSMAQLQWTAGAQAYHEYRQKIDAGTFTRNDLTQLKKDSKPDLTEYDDEYYEAPEAVLSNELASDLGRRLRAMLTSTKAK